MNTHTNIFVRTNVIPAALALFAVAFALLLASCKPAATNPKAEGVDYYTCTMHPSVRSQDPHGKCPICGMDLVPVKSNINPAPPSFAPTNATDVDHFTCTMHPSVHSHDPKGKCPICGMELVPVYKKSAESSSLSGPGDTTAAPAVPSAEKAPTEFTVPLVRQQQIGVRYSSVTRQPLRYDVRTVGLVAVDKQRRWSYVPRMEGYIQKLFVFSPGEMVQSNAPVLSLYSPDVFTAEKELVNALHMRAHSRTNNLPEEAASTEDLLTAARDRLRLWNVTDQQIAALEQDQKPREYFTLYSPFRGVVEDVAVDQGRKVMPGDRVVDLADLSVVWVWAQFYQDDLALLQPGLPVTITTAAYPGETFRGKISVVDPFLNDATRTVRARINVENNDFKLRPEMYVDVNLTVEMGNGLAVPVDAVLPTGLHNIAFVDRGEGRLEPRFVELGREYGSFYEVKGGLKEHDRIVTSANFLIDAEAKVEGALNSW